MNQEYQDRIDQYLLKEMSEEECQSFKQEVEKDGELKEQLEFTEYVRAAIISRSEKLAQIRRWEYFYKITEERRRRQQIFAQENYHLDTVCAYAGGLDLPNHKGVVSSSDKGRICWILCIIAIFIALIVGLVLLLI